MINLLMKFKEKAHILFIFAILYFGFGVWFPSKMAYVNNITMSCVYISMEFISSNMILAALWVRGLL